MAQLLDIQGPHSESVTCDLLPNRVQQHSYSTYRFGGCSAQFNDNTSYQITGTTSLIKGGNYVTMEVWFYRSGETGNYDYMLEWDSTNGQGFNMYVYNSTDKLYIQAGAWNETITKTSANYAATFSTWHHLVYELNRTNGSLNMGLDGVRVGTAAINGDYFFINNNDPIIIGANHSDGYRFNGYLDDLRISNNLRYNLNTFTTYTVPTSPVGVDANTLLYMPFNESQYAISGNLTEPGRIIIREESDWSTIHNQHYSAGAFQVSVPNVNKKMIICRSDSGEVKGYGDITPETI